MATDCAPSADSEVEVRASRGKAVVGATLACKKPSVSEIERADDEVAGCSVWQTVSRRGSARRMEEDRERTVRAPAVSSDRAARKRPAAASSDDGGESTDEERIATRKLKRKTKPASPLASRKEDAAASVERASSDKADATAAAAANEKKNTAASKNEGKGTTLSQISADAGKMVKDVMSYCLDDAKKIGKTQASYIMTRVMALNELLRDALMRNSFLEGRLMSATTHAKSSEPAKQQATAAGPVEHGKAKNRSPRQQRARRNPLRR